MEAEEQEITEKLPSLSEFFAKRHDSSADSGQFARFILQFVEQRECFSFREMRVQQFHDLVVVRSYGVFRVGKPHHDTMRGGIRFCGASPLDLCESVCFSP